jgi:bifunctional DNA-binding transcriptional regulator/antitoxin component of YhaV-PrlF toxin-antitoxin module
MGISKKEEKSVRKLTKLGGKSLGITLPIEDLRELGWKEKQKIRIKRIRGGFEIRDWKNN